MNEKLLKEIVKIHNNTDKSDNYIYNEATHILTKLNDREGYHIIFHKKCHRTYNRSNYYDGIDPLVRDPPRRSNYYLAIDSSVFDKCKCISRIVPYNLTFIIHLKLQQKESLSMNVICVQVKLQIERII